MITLPHLGLSHPQLLPYPSFQSKFSKAFLPTPHVQINRLGLDGVGLDWDEG